MNRCAFPGTEGGLTPMTKQHNMQQKPGRRAGFTLIELLVVMAIIGTLAALVIPLTAVAKRKRTEANIRTQLQKLVTVIEDYHSKYGQYPADNVINRTATLTNVNPALPPLYYELVGTLVDDKTGNFRLIDSQEFIPSAKIKETFNVEGFVNSASERGGVKVFLDKLKPDSLGRVRTGPDLYVLTVPVAWPLARSDQPTAVKGVNPWRYVSSNPTNNPGSYDLWAEFVEGKQVKIISNWTKDISDKP